MKELPIKIICATKKNEDEFYQQTATGKSIVATISASKVDVMLYSNNSVGLGEIYNDAIEKTKRDPAILVFMHDDVWIADFFYADRIREALEKFDITGVVGSKVRVNKQPSWCHMHYDSQNNRLIQHNTNNLSGLIGHGSQLPKKIDYFGPSMLECKLLDGVILATKNNSLISSNTYFDSQFKFHFYDVDFCRSAEQNKLKMGTMRLSVIHESYGGYQSEAWRESYKNYIAKWSE
jgi:hypothetical protein